MVSIQIRISTGGKTVAEHLDIINGHRAYQLLLELARSQKGIDADVIFALHRAVVGDQTSAGKWRTESVYIRGSMHVPPNWVKIARLMDDGLERFAISVRTEHPVVAGATLHLDLHTVHPFQDGNGQTARLVHYGRDVQSRDQRSHAADIRQSEAPGGKVHRGRGTFNRSAHVFGRATIGFALSSSLIKERFA